ncbi:hypothetical protein, partial [Novacetimonas hansenii]
PLRATTAPPAYPFQILSYSLVKDPNPVGPNNLANPPGKLKKFPSAPPVKGDIGPTAHTVNQKNDIEAEKLSQILIQMANIGRELPYSILRNSIAFDVGDYRASLHAAVPLPLV